MKTHNNNELAIRAFLNIASETHCQDLRDKVFGFLGLYRQLGVKLPEPNYKD
jgi:hypothetical protein